MVSPDRLGAFAAVAFIMIVVPGPSVLFTVGRALAYGRRTAIATVQGNAAGSYVLAVLVAVGLGAAVERSLWVYLGLKYAGAAYLVYLGVKAFRARGSLSGAMVDRAMRDGDPAENRRAFREGFVVGVTNPKSVVFFAAVLPQFVDRGQGEVVLQMMILGLVAALIAILSDSVWAFTASSARSWFGRSPRRLAAVGGAGGLAMVSLGLGVAVTGRKD